MNATRARPVLFLPDSGANIGGGHVMRCLTLARALTAQGMACAFVAPPLARRLIERFSDGGVTIWNAQDSDHLPGLVAKAAEVALHEDAAAVVVDHYRLDATQERRLRGPERLVAVLDDLADRNHDCDLLIDPSFGREPGAYAGLVPAAATVLTGTDYGLVRPEFAQLRPEALARRLASGSVAEVLLALGLTDVGGITARVAERLTPLPQGAALTIALGAEAPSRPRLETMVRDHHNVQLMIETPDMARLMAKADVSVGAGGSSLWERACLGLPAITLILADNQAALARDLDARGATVAVDVRAAGWEIAFDSAWARLLAASDEQAKLSRQSAVLCDGRGAERAASVILAKMGTTTGKV